MNIPVICPNIDPFKELVTTNVNGFLCDDKDAYNFPTGYNAVRAG